MLAGTIYIVWFAENFFFPFQGFLITLGVPVAVWSAIFVEPWLEVVAMARHNPTRAILAQWQGFYIIYNY
jgi:hypothetical protein